MCVSGKSNLSRKLIQNTLYMLSGSGFRILVQSLYFVLIARTLGPEEYGIFAAVVALVAVLTPFSSLGSGNLLIKNVSRQSEVFPTYWGAAVATTLVSGTGLVLFSLLLCRIILPEDLPWLVVIAVSTSDLVFASLVNLGGHAFIAVERLGRTAHLHLTLSLSRLIAAIVLLILPVSHSAFAWSVLYLVSSAIASVIALAVVTKHLGWGPLRLHPLLPELREGLYFAIGISAQTAYNDIDKTMLARLSGLYDTGVYAAAYRIINAASIPVSSLVYAAYSRFFKHGAHGIMESAKFARGLLPAATGYGLFSAIAIWILAPLLPKILGQGYHESSTALLWLSCLPLLKAINYFGGDTLTGAGYQGIRTTITVFIAAFNILINLFLLPRYGWLGAAWSSVATDSLLACSLWIAVLHMTQKEKRQWSY
jgi:O-antigen/teichoic acid export membrane protein